LKLNTWIQVPNQQQIKSFHNQPCTGISIITFYGGDHKFRRTFYLQNKAKYHHRGPGAAKPTTKDELHCSPRHSGQKSAITGQQE
jgi:hypothetical protein